MILLLSIFYQGVPAFSPPQDDIVAELTEIESKLAEIAPDASEATALTARQEELQKQQATIEKSFLSKPPAPGAREAGIGPALMGSIWVCIGCSVFFLPLGVGTAIYLEEFKPRNKFLRWLSDMLQLNISNLAGVPSIV